MLTTAPVVHDPARVAGLRRLAVLDTPVEESFDRITRLAAIALGVPVALVSVVDASRQFFKSQLGLPEPWASWRETPLTHSFCQHVVASREPLVVEDAREHPLLRDNLAIRDLGVIAYVGVPLITSQGIEVGSLCAIDARPRAWTAREVALLRDLAATVVDMVEMRAALRHAEPAEHAAAAAPAEDPDRALLARARGGDEAALGELYDRHGPAMWAVACAAGSEEVAEEAVVEALLRARGALLSPRGSVRARLVALARECSREQGPPPSSPCALARLPEEERCVVELAWYGKLPVEEIAAELALPPGVVKRRMLAGLHRLRGAVAVG